MQSNRVLGLFKFGEREHIDELVREGHLYMNTLKYFRERETEDLLRSDKHEGAIHCVQADGATLSMKQDDAWVNIGTIRGQILASDGSEEITNVFCMYAFREKAAIAKIDPKNFEFGDTYAILTDGDEFLRRVRKTAEQEGLTLKHDLVEYVDRSTYNGTMGVFRKFADFAYQSEFRISVVSGLKGTMAFKVILLLCAESAVPYAELGARSGYVPPRHGGGWDRARVWVVSFWDPADAYGTCVR